jgi:hypothetical protein
MLSVVNDVLNELVPKRKPSPNAKRWWTADLTQLCKGYTILRNRVSTHRRAGYRNRVLEAQAKATKSSFFKTLRVQKKAHWEAFLDDADNIWKAARYCNPSSLSPFARVSYLKLNDTTTLESDEDMADALLDSFPPLPPIDVSDNPVPAYSQYTLQPLTMQEIETAIMLAQPRKAPGNDNLSMLVWRELWPVLKNQLFGLFKSSLNAGKLPHSWKIARIIPLRKGVDREYTICSSHRPISLLSTISKIMESVIAERISNLAEDSNLLPKNHFGARKARSTVQALTILQEKILRAWRNRKVLSLVSFDVKGAYNGESAC